MIARSALLARMPHLSGMRLRYLTAEMGCKDVKELTDGQALLLWLANILTACALLPQERQDLLLVELGKEVIDFGDRADALLAELGQDKVAGFMVAIFDRTWASVTGRQDFLDLRQKDYVSQLPHPPVETVLYDLLRLHLRLRVALVRPEPKTEADLRHY